MHMPLVGPSKCQEALSTWNLMDEGFQRMVNFVYGGATYNLENPNYTLALVHFTSETINI